MSVRSTEQLAASPLRSYVKTAYDFDPNSGRLLSVTVTNSSNAVIYQQVFNAYNKAGQQTQVTTTQLVANDDGTSTPQTTYTKFTYDSEGQLTSSHTYNLNGTEVLSKAETFTYDAMGNRTDSGFSMVDPNDPNNTKYAELNQYKIVPGCVATLTYDSCGNLTFDGSYHYSYDPLNRLLKVENAAYTQEVLFTYDNEGRRLTEEVRTGSAGVYNTQVSLTEFAYDGWNLVAEINGMTGHLIRSYTWDPDSSGPGGLLSITTYNPATGVKTGTYNAFSDAHGNVMGLTDAQSGALVATYTYSAFGELLSATGPAADACPFRFSTKYYDAATGLYYSDLRYYSPTMARFLTRNPSGEQNGGANLYAYCGNDPGNSSDPLGLATIMTLPSGRAIVGFSYEGINQDAGVGYEGSAGVLRIGARPLEARPEQEEVEALMNSEGTQITIYPTTVSTERLLAAAQGDPTLAGREISRATRTGEQAVIGSALEREDGIGLLNKIAARTEAKAAGDVLRLDVQSGEGIVMGAPALAQARLSQLAQVINGEIPLSEASLLMPLKGCSEQLAGAELVSADALVGLQSSGPLLGLALLPDILRAQDAYEADGMSGLAGSLDQSAINLGTAIVTTELVGGTANALVGYSVVAGGAPTLAADLCLRTAAASGTLVLGAAAVGAGTGYCAYHCPTGYGDNVGNHIIDQNFYRVQRVVNGQGTMGDYLIAASYANPILPAGFLIDLFRPLPQRTPG